MKKILFILFITLILFGSVNAIEYQKSFENIGKYGKIEIKQGISKVADYVLTDNSEYCLINCYAEGTATLYKKGKLFNEVKFYDKKKQETKIRWYKIYLLVPENFEAVFNSTHNLTRTRTKQVEYNYESLNPGEYRWRIEGDKIINQNIDWIANVNNIELSEWAWWNSTFTKKKQINITETSGSTILNYSLRVYVDYDPDMQADFDDIRFTNSSENGELYYWLETKTDSTEAYFWVNIPSLTASSIMPIYMYYGNPSAASAKNINKTFLFGDDFDDGVIDAAKWTTYNQISESGGNAVFTLTLDGTNNRNNLKSVSQFGTNTELIYKTGTLSLDGASYDDDVSIGYSAFDGSAAQGYMLNSGTYIYSKVGATEACYSDGFKSTSAGTSTNTTSLSSSRLIYAGRKSTTNVYETYSTTIKSLSANIPSENLYIGASAYACAGSVGSTPMQINFMAVRNYSTSEPTISTGQEFNINLSVVLSSPANKANTFKNTNYFFGLLSSDYYNITNATLYVWYSNTTLLTTNVTTFAGTSTYETANLSLNLPAYDVYSWNYYGCGYNGSLVACNFASVNQTINKTRLFVNSETYSTSTIEGTTESFSINISKSELLSITTASLNYDSASYSPSITTSGDYAVLTKSLTIPYVSSDQTKTFNWSITFSDSITNITTSRTQTVLNTGIDNCSVNGIKLINFTFVDEELQTPLNSTVEIEINLYPINSYLTSALANFSQKFINVSTASICMNTTVNGTGYYYNVIVSHEGTDHVNELYHIQKFSLTNTTQNQNITLYDLATVDSTEFLITYKDSSFVPIENALIFIQRKYISEGVFKTVEVPKTDRYGQTIGHFDTNNVVYNILVSKNGATLATFNNIAVKCQDSTIGKCEISLNALSSITGVTDYANYKNLNYNISFDKSARTITINFQTTDGSSSTMLINATKFDRFGNNSVCSNSLYGSAGSLVCSIPSSYGNVTVYYELYKDSEKVTQGLYSIIPDSFEVFGYDGYVMALITLITIPFMLSSSLIGVVIGVAIGFIFAIGLMLFVGSSILGVTSTIIFLLIGGGILVWKLVKKER